MKMFRKGIAVNGNLFYISSPHAIPKSLDRKSVLFGITKPSRSNHLFIVPKSQKRILEYLKITLDIYEHESYNGYIGEQQNISSKEEQGMLLKAVVLWIVAIAVQIISAMLTPLSRY